MQSRRSFAFLSLIFVAGIIFTKVVGVGFSATNDMEFCTSCHSMKVNLEEYKQTVHYKNASGVRATCADCHVPKPLVPQVIAKIVASRDILSEIIGTIDTKEKYEKHRWEMASRVWAKMEASDSRECRDCHDYAHMDLSEQQRIARKRHNKAVDQGKTCIDCHKGIAHEEPEEPEEVE
jgi:cytochrome c-type protein NapC